MFESHIPGEIRALWQPDGALTVTARQQLQGEVDVPVDTGEPDLPTKLHQWLRMVVDPGVD